MTFLLVVALLLGITIVPVMIGARVVKAENTGVGSAIFAVILLIALSSAVTAMVPNHFLGFIVSTVFGAAILAWVLGTTFVKGLGVSAVIAVVQMIVILAFLGAAVGVKAAT